MNTKELLAYQYDLLANDGMGYTEIRVFPQTYFCEGKEAFIAEAFKHINENAYVGIQPRVRKAGDISAINYLNTLCLDLDPVRPKDTGSTQEQHQEALSLATKIVNDLGSGTVVSSGSGAHVYIPIKPVQVEDREALSD